MNKIEQFGPFTIYEEDTTDILSLGKETTIRLYNGLDEIAHEIYYNVNNAADAARDFMRRSQNAYTMEDITAACRIVEIFNDRDVEAVYTDHIGDTKFYFRRYSPESRYFKQYLEKPETWKK